MSCSPFGRSIDGSGSRSRDALLNNSTVRIAGGVIGSCGGIGDGAIRCSGGDVGPGGCAVSRFESGDGELLTIGGGLTARLRRDSFKTSHAAATNTAKTAKPKANRHAR